MIIPTLKLPTNLQIFSTTDIPPLVCNPHNTTKLKPIKIAASSSSSLLAQEPSSILDKDDDDDDGAQVIEKIRVVVRPMERPRLVLKFMWMEKNIGIAINQVIPGGSGTIPLSPYYFWPRKDAWEELKVMLERKPWISRKQVVVLLNQATDIIHLWQQAGGRVD